MNNNLLCAVDVETTGLDPSRHELVQIAVVPLNANCEPAFATIDPFLTYIAPCRYPRSNWDPEALRTHKIDCDQLLNTAVDPWKASEEFERWFERLNLPFRKKITILAHNYPCEHGFINSWLGPVAFDDFFYGYRDTMALANSLNDIADVRSEPYPYPKVSLRYLCSQLKVENMKPHDALADAVATAECYRRMLMRPGI